MNLSDIADLADLLTALGVLISLGFVVFELRKNTRQAQLTNQQSVISGLREARDWFKDPEVAEVIVRGRKEFDRLSVVEKEIFQAWAMNSINAFHMTIMHGDALAHKGAPAARNNLRQMFTDPGVRRWYVESGLEGRWPTDLVAEVKSAIAASEKEAD